MVTEECNFLCSYCYQEKEKKSLTTTCMKKAVDFFSPFFSDRCSINFFGGEPLLAFSQIEETVSYIEKQDPGKEFRFGITSNGSLIDENILRFFNRHKFSLTLSFDGLAQDVSRKKGSFVSTLRILKKILEYPDIALKTNSVFTPETLKYLPQSMKLIADMNVPDIQFAFSTLQPWKDTDFSRLEQALETLKGILVSIYKKTGSIPLSTFRDGSSRGVFGCNGGKDRLAITPDGKLWGCYLFHDYFKGKEGAGDYRKYCFGDIDCFIEKRERLYPQILANYAKLRVDYYSMRGRFCMLCDDIEECFVCPIECAFPGTIGCVPHYICKLKKIIRKAKRELWEEL